MKAFALIFLFFMLAGCVNDDLSWISIRNATEVPIYARAYSSEFSDGNWIQPGVLDEFYSINCDCLDGFEYFSFYYDSLIVYLEGHEEDPVKFYQNGSAVNYDPILNPFTNPDVWRNRKFDRNLPGDSFNSLIQEKHVSEHYFIIDQNSIKSLNKPTPKQLIPAP